MNSLKDSLNSLNSLNGTAHNVTGASHAARAGAVNLTALSTEKLLPQNVEAEAGVLGSLLIDPEALALVADWLRAADFYRESHRIIYQAMLDLAADSMACDLLTLIDELQRRGALDEVGGASAVSALANQVPTSANLESYAHIVERTATLRRLIHAAGQIAGVAYNEPDADVAVDAAEQLLSEAARRGETRRPAQRLGGDMRALVEFVQEGIAAAAAGAAGQQLLGITTGQRELDRLLGGLQRGDLDLLAARPRVGKSALMLNIAHAAALAGHHVLIISLEMSRAQLALRLCAMESGVDLARLKQPHQLNDDELAAVLEATGRLAELEDRLTIDDTRGLTVQQIRARARQVAREVERRGGSLDLLIVDYVQFIAESAPTHGARRSENRTQALGDITQGLKRLAGELDCAVLGLAQLSRAIETRADKTPLLSDLRESGALENDADVVMFLHRDEVFNPESERRHIADVIVAKQRNGAEGTVSLYWDGPRQWFRDLELRHVVPDMPPGY